MGLIKNSGKPLSQAVPLDSRDIDMLLAGLDSSDATLRRMAASDLIAFPHAEEALGELLQRETDPQVLESLMNTLAAYSTSSAVEKILPALRADDAFKRNLAIEVLKTLPDLVAPHIEALLEDADPDVRIFTVNVLESLRHPKVLPWLLSVLKNDQHVNVCATALDLLAEVGSEECLPVLDTLMKRYQHEPYLMYAAQIVMDRIVQTREVAQ